MTNQSPFRRSRSSLPVLKNGTNFSSTGTAVRCADCGPDGPRDAHGERTKPAQLHPIAASQGIHDLLKDHVDDALDVAMVKMRVRRCDLLDQLGFDHGTPRLKTKAL